MIPWMWMLMSLSLAITDSLVRGGDQFPVRNTTYGQIRGYIYRRPNGAEVERYMGVPYAKPPTGNLRFQMPFPPEPWQGVRNATIQSCACVQSQLDQHYIRDHDPDFDGQTSEDCLYLNIYVPIRHERVLEPPLLPVIVHIHGGSNEAGMGAMLHGDALASEGNLIVVTMNYRLGVLGFLSAPHLDITGNYGLYDQALSMLWVKENIDKFGGDPDKVTCQGHSAGSSDVGFHVLSPISKGLFRSAILLSGSPTAFWALIPPSSPTEERSGPNRHLENLGCYFGTDKTQTWSCLREQNISKFYDISFHHSDGYFTFAPVVDNQFLLADPKNGIEGPVNARTIMIGVVRDEGSLTAEVIMKNEIKKKILGRYLTGKQLMKNYNEHIEPVESFNDSLYRQFASPPMRPYTSYSYIEDLSYYVYKPWSDPDNVTAGLIALSDLVGDATFTAPAIDLADRLAAVDDLDLFVYSFEHRSPTSRYPLWMGVPHGDDLFYLFGCPIDGHPLRNYTELDGRVSQGYIQLWSKYVYSGWPSDDKDSTQILPYTEGKSYIRVSSNTTDLVITNGRYLRDRHIAYWNHLLPTLMGGAVKVKGRNRSLVLWGLTAACLLLFVLCLILLGCLVHYKRKVRGRSIVSSRRDDDAGKVPMLFNK
ncbi:unnamed protein product [Lymnaea stagnalis]|uniref:Carboxylesterase type B domain-containing protein n=1 Tax=Lymnaea stagnalis TaxID=6523 RepID=A0AAV2IAL5_LYMST